MVDWALLDLVDCKSRVLHNPEGRLYTWILFYWQFEQYKSESTELSKS
jgi:hypothetical protein